MQRSYLEDDVRSLLPEANIVAVYLGGSRLFGCAREDSDWDLRVVLSDEGGASLKITETQVGDRLYNVTLYSQSEFQQRLEEHEINVVLCVLSPHEFKWKEPESGFAWILNPQTLRASLFRKANSCFNRAKVYFERENDVVSGKKVAGLSLRFLAYGLQILEHGTIIDLGAPNPLVQSVEQSLLDDWAGFRAQFHPVKHQLMDRYPAQSPSASRDMAALESRHPGAYIGATEKEAFRMLLEGRQERVDPALWAQWMAMGEWLANLPSSEDRAVQKVIWARARGESPLDWMCKHQSLKEVRHVFRVFASKGHL